MTTTSKIITVALSPCWDVTCWGKNLNWGHHVQIDSQESRPAGKALNVSRALDWLGIASIAAGLWGVGDYGELQSDLASWARQITPAMTPVPGQTRHNITLIDQQRNEELHLRAPNRLASIEAIQQLREDLANLVAPEDTCVFAGSLPSGAELQAAVELTRQCKEQGGRLVVDASGRGLRDMVESGAVDFIKPNVEELVELLGRDVADEPAALAAAARTLTDQVPMILVSRGAAGAMLITAEGVWSGVCQNRDRKVSVTVGCGDYLLAGFLAGYAKKLDLQQCLRQAIAVATAKAWGLADKVDWSTAQDQVEVAVEVVH
ncbi:MAG: hypothetical protein JW936_04775 [Sedimentisphaerales bacterium]|nr:hypothetical protein [Sedimentisphaerales bacterium]